MSDLGKLLVKLRGEMSLREASKRSGLSYSYISSLEKGQHPKTKAPIQASPESLKALSKAYNYPHRELMKAAGYIEEEKTNEQPNAYLTEEQRKAFLDENARKIAEAYYKLPKHKRKIFDDLAKTFMEDKEDD